MSKQPIDDTPAGEETVRCGRCYQILGSSGDADLVFLRDMHACPPRKHHFLGRVPLILTALGAILVFAGAASILMRPPDLGPGSVVLPSGSLGTMPPLVAEFPSFTAVPSLAPTLDPTLAPTDSPTMAPTPTPINHTVTRIVMTRARVDLPVITAPTNEKFPSCDVAERMAYYGEPGQGGVVYLYAHATHYMFGGLLAASWQPNSYLLGAQIQIYTSDSLVYTYAVTEIDRHQAYNSFAIANNMVGEALLLQACENNDATGPKLIVVARPVSVTSATYAASHPHTAPRACAHGY